MQRRQCFLNTPYMVSTPLFFLYFFLNPSPLTFFDIFWYISPWWNNRMKDLLSKEHYWYKIRTLLMKKQCLPPFIDKLLIWITPLCFYKKILRILRPRNATSVILKNYVFANLRDINQKKRQKWKITCTNPTYQHPFGGVGVYIKEKFSFTVRKDLN